MGDDWVMITEQTASSCPEGRKKNCKEAACNNEKRAYHTKV